MLYYCSYKDTLGPYVVLRHLRCYPGFESLRSACNNQVQTYTGRFHTTLIILKPTMFFKILFYIISSQNKTTFFEKTYIF